MKLNLIREWSTPCPFISQFLANGHGIAMGSNKNSKRLSCDEYNIINVFAVL